MTGKDHRIVAPACHQDQVDIAQITQHPLETRVGTPAHCRGGLQWFITIDINKIPFPTRVVVINTLPFVKVNLKLNPKMMR